MKTSNKIFIGFISFLILLAIAIMLLLKSNFVPTNNLNYNNSRDYGMGDIEGIKAEGEFVIRPFINNQDSWVKIRSESPILESFTVSKNEENILILGTQNEESLNREAVVSVKMKQCNFFDLGGKTQMHVEQRFEAENVVFNLKNKAIVTVPINADTIRLNLIDESSIYLEGKANVIILEAKGQSKIDAKDLEVNEAIVSINDSSRVEVNVKDKFSGKQEGESDFQNIGEAKGSVRRSMDID